MERFYLFYCEYYILAGYTLYTRQCILAFRTSSDTNRVLNKNAFSISGKHSSIVFYFNFIPLALLASLQLIISD